jgi:hypothetical protein
MNVSFFIQSILFKIECIFNVDVLITICTLSARKDTTSSDICKSVIFALSKKAPFILVQAVV